MITRINEFLQGDYFNEVKEVILTEFVGLCIFKGIWDLFSFAKNH